MRLSLSDPWLGSAQSAGTPIDWDSDHANGLVGFWPCWEGAGQLVEDIAGGFHASIPSQNIIRFTWADGEDGIAVSQLAIPTLPSAYLNTPALNVPQFTVSYRCKLPIQLNSYKGMISCKPTGLNGFMVVTENTSASTYQPHLVVSNAAGAETNKKTTTIVTLPMTRFMHFVWTWDGTTARHWQDGSEQPVTASADAGWGAITNSLFFAYQASVGSYYDIRIYNQCRPELAPELYDPSTRWKVFQSPRATIRSVSGSGLLGGENMFGGFVNMPGGFVNG